MAKFAYNNAKNINIDYMFFELSCKYYFYIFYKKKLQLLLKVKNYKKFYF